MDETGSIKFNGTIPFLDLLLGCQPDGAVSTRNPRTNQYLHFRSHHPINHKTGVVRTLMNRKNKPASMKVTRTRKSYSLNLLQSCLLIAIITVLKHQSLAPGKRTTLDQVPKFGDT